jgi:hypothetical protein
MFANSLHCFAARNSRFDHSGWVRTAGAFIAAHMMTRLQFLRSLAQLGLAAVVIPACTKDDGTPPAPDAGTNNARPDAPATSTADAAVDAPIMPTCTATTTTIASNHGHMITVSAADVSAGVDKTYAIQGGSLHPHTVLITAASFATLRELGTLTVMTSMDANHRHMVTVTCA